MARIQQEIEFIIEPMNTKPRKKKAAVKVDYDKIFDLFESGEVTFKQIEQASGVSHGSVANVIAVLTIRYPIYDVRRGVYKLIDGANFYKLKKENKEK